MKIAIYGAGAMGTVLGAYLTKSGLDVDLFARNKEHVEALKKKGAHIIGTTSFTVQVNAFYPHELSTLYDFIFLTTKQRNNDEVVNFLKDYVKEDGAIVVMQNGIPEMKVAKIIGDDKVIGCTMNWGATYHGKGVSELTSKASHENLTFNIGPYKNIAMYKVKKAADILENMGKVTIEDNLIGARYAKLLVNASMSGLSVITGKTFGYLANNKESRLLALAIIKECINVAKKGNIEIEKLQGHDIVKWMDYNNKIERFIAGIILKLAMKKHRNIKSSMLRDLDRGLKTEVNFINGAVCDMGREYNVKTPLNDKIVALVREIENKDRLVSLNNLKELKKPQ